MSRASIPSAFSASMTACWRVAFWAIASCAVAASVLTPSEIVAMSGWVADWPSPVTLRRAAWGLGWPGMA